MSESRHCTYDRSLDENDESSLGERRTSSHRVGAWGGVRVPLLSQGCALYAGVLAVLTSLHFENLKLTEILNQIPRTLLMRKMVAAAAECQCDLNQVHRSLYDVLMPCYRYAKDLREMPLMRDHGCSALACPLAMRRHRHLD